MQPWKCVERPPKDAAREGAQGASISSASSARNVIPIPGCWRYRESTGLLSRWPARRHLDANGPLNQRTRQEPLVSASLGYKAAALLTDGACSPVHPPSKHPRTAHPLHFRELQLGSHSLQHTPDRPKPAPALVVYADPVRERVSVLIAGSITITPRLHLSLPRYRLLFF